VRVAAVEKVHSTSFLRLDEILDDKIQFCRLSEELKKQQISLISSLALITDGILCVLVAVEKHSKLSEESTQITEIFV
jgi:hypothetical protein